MGLLGVQELCEKCGESQEAHAFCPVSGSPHAAKTNCEKCGESKATHAVCPVSWGGLPGQPGRPVWATWTAQAAWEAWGLVLKPGRRVWKAWKGRICVRGRSK